LDGCPAGEAAKGEGREGKEKGERGRRGRGLLALSIVQVQGKKEGKGEKRAADPSSGEKKERREKKKGEGGGDTFFRGKKVGGCFKAI